MARGESVMVRGKQMTSTGRHGMMVDVKKPEPDRLQRGHSEAVKRGSLERKPKKS